MKVDPPSFRLACALVCACLILASCSAIRTVYNQADHLVAWRLDDYFDMSESQRALFQSRFGALHRWHRRTELPGYIALLGAVEQRLEHGPGRSDIDWLRTQMHSRAQATLNHGQDDIAAFLSSLTDQQVAQARQRFDRDNRKWAREHGAGASADEQKRLRAKHDMERLEDWTGALTKEQKVRIAELNAALPADADARLRDRVRRQNEFLALLTERKDAARFPARMRQWMTDWDASRPPDLDAELDRIDRLRADMFLGIYAVLTPEQRGRMRDRVRWYADALRELAGRQSG